MSITGGIKFFEKSQNLSVDGSSATGSTGNSSANLAIDKNVYTVWQTVGSNDATTETFTVVMPSVKNISRIFLQKHNFKNYTVKYWNGATYVDFTNVTSLDSSTPVTGIAETVYARATSYYECDLISTDRLRVSITLTQVANAEKYLSQLIGCTELGTFEGFPEIANFSHDANERVQTGLSGKSNIEKSYRVASLALGFNFYPGQNDINLIQTLFDRVEGFNVWVCGGRFGNAYFRFTQLGYNLEDLFFMQTLGSLSTIYGSNIYTNAVVTSLNFKEIF